MAYNKTHQAEALAVKQKITLFPMPSTSPANASWTIEKMLPVWGRIYKAGFYD